MKVISFVGTRPETIKNLSMFRAAKNIKDLDFMIIHTSQNVGQDMADCFIDQLGLPVIDQNLPLDRSTEGSMAKSLIDYISVCMKKYSPDIVISNTDTNTAFYTALMGVKLKIPVAHIEGGIRCVAFSNPEEVNRKLSDHLSRWIFTISNEDSQSLLTEGLDPQSIFMLGDITLDTLNIIKHEQKISVTSGDYNLLTIHRQENINDPKGLNCIIAAVEEAGVKTIFPVHPRTYLQLENFGLLRNLEKSKVIEICKPQGYIEMLKLLAGCRKVMSDSGGLRREAYMLNKPVISLVWFVWFKQMNQLGFEFIGDADKERITWAIHNYLPAQPRPPIFGDGNAAEHILRTLVNGLNVK